MARCYAPPPPRAARVWPTWASMHCVYVFISHGHCLCIAASGSNSPSSLVKAPESLSHRRD